jgi:murein L,D-transpeptidase YcbB/YkuD
MPSSRLSIFPLILSFCLLYRPLFGETQEELPSDPSAQYLQEWLTSSEAELQIGGQPLLAPELVALFYQARNFQPVWCAKDQVGPQAQLLLEAAEATYQDGLALGEYHLEKILNLMGFLQSQKKLGHACDPLRLAGLDVLLSDAFFGLAVHLSCGRVNPQTLSGIMYRRVITLDYIQILNEALAKSDFKSPLAALTPQAQGYQRLKACLAQYRKLNEEAIWGGELTTDFSLEQTTEVAGNILVLREKLKTLGDIPNSKTALAMLPDEVLLAGLKHFQTRHGLEPSGLVNAATRSLLNQPLEFWIDKIILNMERWRWVQPFLRSRDVLVNIPAYQFQLIENEKTIFLMKVIVGKNYTRTPSFSNSLQYIVVNPRWDIPANIFLRSKLEKTRAKPSILKEEGIKVFRGWGENSKELDPTTIDWAHLTPEEIYANYRFQQASGPGNPLGQIKFMFPNPYNVYLHDTPEKHLFEKQFRSYSSGCIRIEKPLEFAVYLLQKKPFWNENRLRSALSGCVEQKIKLTSPIPIHIIYHTVWVDDTGQLQMRDDLYGRDPDLERLMQQNDLITLKP